MNRRLVVIGDSPEIRNAMRLVLEAGEFKLLRSNGDREDTHLPEGSDICLTLFDVSTAGRDRKEICNKVIDLCLSDLLRCGSVLQRSVTLAGQVCDDSRVQRQLL